jgi:hypothetical protein
VVAALAEELFDFGNELFGRCFMIRVVVPFEFGDELDRLGVFLDIGIDLANVLLAFALQFVCLKLGAE